MKLNEEARTPLLLSLVNPHSAIAKAVWWEMLPSRAQVLYYGFLPNPFPTSLNCVHVILGHESSY